MWLALFTRWVVHTEHCKGKCVSEIYLCREFFEHINKILQAIDFSRVTYLARYPHEHDSIEAFLQIC